MQMYLQFFERTTEIVFNHHPTLKSSEMPMYKGFESGKEKEQDS